MRLLSFLSRRSAAAPTEDDLRKAQARADAAFALADDLARDLERHREQSAEALHSAAEAMERMIERHNFLARQVRERSVASKGQDLHKARRVSPEVEGEDGASEIFAFIREAAEFTRP